MVLLKIRGQNNIVAGLQYTERRRKVLNGPQTAPCEFMERGVTTGPRAGTHLTTPESWDATREKIL